MKKTVLNLLGVALMAIVSFVSCEKEQLSGENEKRNDPEKNKVEWNVCVSDSVMYYRDGNLSFKRINEYDSLGKPQKCVEYGYDKNGVLIGCETTDYYYRSTSFGHIEYSTYSHFNDRENSYRWDITEYGSGKSVTRTEKKYYNKDGEWLYFGVSYYKRENDHKQTLFSDYVIFEGEMTLTYRIDSTIVYVAGTDSIIELEVNTYLRRPKYDVNDEDEMTATFLAAPVWTRTVMKKNADGRVLENSMLSSNDSVNWYGSRRTYEYVVNEKGDLEQVIMKLNDENYSKQTVTYCNDLIVKEDVFTWSTKDSAYVLAGTLDVYRNESDKIDSVVILSSSNSINPSQLPLAKGTNASIISSAYFSEILQTVEIGNGSKCVMVYDDNGNLKSEILYKKVGANVFEEIAICTLDADFQNRSYFGYLVKKLDNGQWRDIKFERDTYNSDGKLLTCIRCIWNYMPGIVTESTDEYEYTYDSYGNNKYYRYHQSTHGEVNVNGQTNTSDSDYEEKWYNSTIKRYLD